MSSLITRGFDKYDRIVSRGYGRGWLGIIRTEIVRRVSRFYKEIKALSVFG